MAWEYNHGIVLRGIEQVYRHTGDARYLTYIQRYADAFVSAAGVVNIPAEHSFDNIQPSVLLPFLYQQTGAAKYQTRRRPDPRALRHHPAQRRRRLLAQADLPQPDVARQRLHGRMPFLMRYGATFGTCGTFCNDTVAQQLLLVAQSRARLRRPASSITRGTTAPPAPRRPGPMRAPAARRWSGAAPWAGTRWRSSTFWPTCRPPHASRGELLAPADGMASALQATQDPATGLWFQVVDQGARTDDWTETSGSGMFVYALKVAVDRGYLASSYLTVANRGWQGCSQGDERRGRPPTITGAVQGMGVQIDYAGYVPPAADAVQLAARVVRDPAGRQRDGSAVAWPCLGSRCWRSLSPAARRRLRNRPARTRRGGGGISRPGISCSGATS